MTSPGNPVIKIVRTYDTRGLKTNKSSSLYFTRESGVRAYLVGARADGGLSGDERDHRRYPLLLVGVHARAGHGFWSVKP